MIVFTCPHCSNRLEVDDSYAGHDGWCRKCKNMITVPRPGSRALDDLTPAEKCQRLAKAFQHAATKADRYHVLFLRTAEENDRLAGQLQDLPGLTDRLARAEKTLDELRAHVLPPESESARIAAEGRPTLDALHQDVVRLAAELDRAREERSTLTEAADRVTRLDEKVQGALDALSTREQEMKEQTTLTAAAVERLRDDVESQHRRAIEMGAKVEPLTAAVDALGADLKSFEKHIEDRISRSEIMRPADRTVIDAGSVSGDSPVDVAGALKTELASVKGRVDAIAGQIRTLPNLAKQLNEGTERLSAALTEFEASRSAMDAVAASVERISESLEGAHRQAATFQDELSDAVSTLSELRRNAEEERAARKAAEREQGQLRGRVEDLAAGLEVHKSDIEAPAVPEAIISDSSTEGEASRSVSEVDAHGGGAEAIKPEVIDEDSEAAQQMMLNTFLRFIYSTPRNKE